MLLLLIGAGTWKINQVIFFRNDCYIESIPIAIHAREDNLVWCHHRGNKIKLKDVHSILPSSNVQENGLSYQWICKLEVGMRIKMFWWKVVLRRLPTKQLLCHRNIIPQEQMYCDVCNLIEDCNHVIIVSLCSAMSLRTKEDGNY